MAEFGVPKGILVPLVTPLNADESVDSEGLRKLIHSVLAGGVHGVVVLGSAGEFAALTDREKRRAIQITVEEVAGRVPVVVGTGEPGTRRALEMTRTAELLGADCALAVPPYYYLLDQAAILDYYRALCSETRLPILLYNIPFFTKNTLGLDVVSRLAEKPGIVGIKDSSGDIVYFQNLLKRVGSPIFGVLQGHDYLLLTSLAAGGDGGVSPGANVVPVWFVELYDAVLHRKWDQAWEAQRRIISFHTGTNYGTFPAGIKGALALLGVGQKFMASPLSSVGDEEVQQIEANLRGWGLL